MQFLAALAANMLKWLITIGYAALSKFIKVRKEQKVGHEETKRTTEALQKAQTPEERATAADGVINNI